MVAWSAGFDSRPGPPAGAPGSSKLPPQVVEAPIIAAAAGQPDEQLHHRSIERPEVVPIGISRQHGLHTARGRALQPDHLTPQVLVGELAAFAAARLPWLQARTARRNCANTSAGVAASLSCCTCCKS